MNEPMNARVPSWTGRQMGVVATVISALIGAGPAAAAAAEELEELVITAERRATNLQDTPLSIQALSAEAMEEKGLADLADVAIYTPNLSISGSRGSGNNQPSFAIRGISGGGGAGTGRAAPPRSALQWVMGRSREVGVTLQHNF